MLRIAQEPKWSAPADGRSDERAEGLQSVFHVTLLSNLARAYDKYRGEYRKSAIPESRFPDLFHVLLEHQLHIGVEKSLALLERRGIPGDRLIVLRAELEREALEPNSRNGVGWVWPSPDLPLHALHEVDTPGGLGPVIGLASAMAQSHALHSSSFKRWAAMRPRSISFLPVARGCQAACSFCFSEASASVVQSASRLNGSDVDMWLRRARDEGAERAVITGGGEPTLMKTDDLLRLVRACRSTFSKVVLITNGLALARQGAEASALQLKSLHDAGLAVLAVSRHHAEDVRNTSLMKIDTCTPALLDVWRSGAAQWPGLRLRLVCVLQRGGVASVEDVDAYVRWAADNGVGEVCFKELYVSTSEESVWHSRASNQWSADQQVPLAVVHRWARRVGLCEQTRLPWGAPIYVGNVARREMRVAAYTEPSLFWERRHGIARSWNVMADGRCFASLEDRSSELTASMREVQP